MDLVPRLLRLTVRGRRLLESLERTDATLLRLGASLVNYII
jgi:hypothetical protein